MTPIAPLLDQTGFAGESARPNAPAANQRLALAASDRDLELAKKALKNGADPRLSGTGGNFSRSALAIAAGHPQEDQQEITQLILDAAAPLSDADAAWVAQALHAALAARNMAAFILTLKAAPDPNWATEGRGGVAYMAASSGSLDFIQALLADSRVDWNQGAANGDTPLMAAARKNDARALRLIATRERAQARNEQQRNALLIAGSRGWVDNVEALLPFYDLRAQEPALADPEFGFYLLPARTLMERALDCTFGEEDQMHGIEFPLCADAILMADPDSPAALSFHAMTENMHEGAPKLIPRHHAWLRQKTEQTELSRAVFLTSPASASMEALQEEGALEFGAVLSASAERTEPSLLSRETRRL